jgi:protein-S-isoprenylcysteine O-methyltransferase Ste14
MGGGSRSAGPAKVQTTKGANMNALQKDIPLNPLENRIPPPIVVLIIGALMGALARYTPNMALPNSWRLALAGITFAVGLVIGGAGVFAFRRARTTINPVNLQAASVLVTTGIFRISRNPMYVGFTALLSAWAIYLAAPWAVIGPVAFVIFTQRFQIRPEERVMLAKFAGQYADYQTRVRRWL